MMWNHYDEFSWAWYVVMPLVMVGFWALAVWAVVTVVRGARPAAPDAEAVLAERYARGEIDSDEYRHRLDELRAVGAARGDVPGR